MGTDSISGEMSQYVPGHTNDTLDVDNSGQPITCVLCQRLLSSYHEGGDLETVSICGDCKFLFLEDLGTPIQEGYLRRRGLRRRRRRYTSSESIENFFSQQFYSHMIDMARNNQPIISSDAAARLSQHVSLHATPTGSRRWRRVLSDTESDGFGSLYGESESNVSFNGYRHVHVDSDTFSYSAYGGDSDASVDGRTFLENETFVNPEGASDFDTDTDIDPMHAGLYHWNSDDPEEEVEGEEDNEWGEVDDDESIVESWRVSARFRSSTSPDERRASVNLRRRITNLEFEGTTRLSIRESRGASYANISANLEELEDHDYAGNYENFLNTRRFEELLERLSENDDSRRGAPPAASSFLQNLPCIVINNNHENLDDLACAICKDSLSVGTVVNQLPCFHLYHPSCIAPWLSARNSCPLCRYELPTDDKDYESRKQMGSSGLDLHQIQQQELNGDSSSEFSDGAEANEHDELVNGRRMHHGLSNVNVVAESSSRAHARRSFFRAAAAPIVSIVGIVLVLWLGNSLTRRTLPSGPPAIHGQRQQLNTYLGSCPPNRRVEAGRRRWWSLF